MYLEARRNLRIATALAAAQDETVAGSSSPLTH